MSEINVETRSCWYARIIEIDHAIDWLRESCAFTEEQLHPLKERRAWLVAQIPSADPDGSPPRKLVAR
jgi:hypothetical protein